MSLCVSLSLFPSPWTANFHLRKYFCEGQWWIDMPCFHQESKLSCFSSVVPFFQTRQAVSYP